MFCGASPVPAWFPNCRTLWVSTVEVWGGIAEPHCPIFIAGLVSCATPRTKKVQPTKQSERFGHWCRPPDLRLPGLRCDHLWCAPHRYIQAPRGMGTMITNVSKRQEVEKSHAEGTTAEKGMPQPGCELFIAFPWALPAHARLPSLQGGALHLVC